ncbi:MAG: DUF4197 domain-containing protein [Spirochaetia bacterium]|nr:DUF4197 domain-containing protein [Spirochaetia bacterium]
MKKNYIKLISIFLTVSIFSSLILFTSCLSTLSDFADGMLGGYSGKSYSFTNEEAITAMKDALVEGISSASRNLSKTDAYYKNAALKIMLPKEADPIIQILTQIPGGQTLANDVVLRLNRTAECAAKDTISIFTSSIKGMTVTDGVKIVTGRRDAATQYLRDKCYDKLVSLYKPKVSKALDQPLVAGVCLHQLHGLLLLQTIINMVQFLILLQDLLVSQNHSQLFRLILLNLQQKKLLMGFL